MKYIDIERRTVAITTLRADSFSAKPAKLDEDCRALRAYYHDASSGATMARLAALGMGIADNTRPAEISLLRWVIDQLAVAYANAPTRWLIGGNSKRLAESNADIVAMRRTLKRSRYDRSWRFADRMRALCGQVVMRYFAIDRLGRVAVRAFTPDGIDRVPNDDAADEIEADHAIALRFSDRSSEVWERDGDVWYCARVADNGMFLDDAKQPFSESGFVSTYAKLPMLITYDDEPNGAPWIPPRATRLAAVETINALVNEALVLVQKQAHSSRFVTGMRADEIPSEDAPGSVIAIPNQDARAYDLTPDPAIKDAIEFAREAIRILLRSEGLPADAFEASARVLTGSSLKAQMRELIERRKNQVPVAEEDEAAGWARFVAVHNAHRFDPPLLDAELEVELGAFELPTDQREVIDVTAREMALGIASKVDAVMRLRNLSRDGAIKVLEQVEIDATRFAPVPMDGADAATLAQDGPRTALPDPVTVGTGSASVVDAVAKTDAPQDAADTFITGTGTADVATEKVATNILNGAQVDAAKALVEEAAAGLIPVASARAMLIAFYGLTAEQVDAIMAPLAGFKQVEKVDNGPKVPGSEVIK